jgi:hypothetical protein
MDATFWDSDLNINFQGIQMLNSKILLLLMSILNDQKILLGILLANQGRYHNLICNLFIRNKG